MKFVTRANVRVGRIACTWLIQRHIDAGAEILYLPENEIAEQLDAGATGFHVPGGQFTHRDGKTPFEGMLEQYGLSEQPALDLMGRIINGADTDNSRYGQAEGPGVRAVAEGFRALDAGDDGAVLAATLPVMDALYAYCRERAGAEAPDFLLT